MRTFLSLALTAFLVQCVYAQPAAKATTNGAYLVPLDSEGNRLELTLATDKALTLRVQSMPDWVHIQPSEITTRGPVIYNPVVFSFSVSAQAPIGEAGDVVFAVVHAGQVLVEKTISVEAKTPQTLTLNGNYPNPFNPTTRISFTLPEEAEVKLHIYNTLGQEVKQLLNQPLEAGTHAVDFVASDLPSGIYFYRLETLGPNGDRSQHHESMTLLK